MHLSKKPGKKLVIIISVATVIVLIFPTIYFMNNDPRTTSTSGTNSFTYSGPMSTTTTNPVFINRTWANATISQGGYPNSSFWLMVNGSAFSNYDGGNVTEEGIMLEFGGSLAYDLHPRSVTLEISISGSTELTLTLQDLYQTGNNVSFSDKQGIELTFSGNNSSSAIFPLRNVPVTLFPASSGKEYEFNYRAVFILEQPTEPTASNFFNTTAVLNGISSRVSDSVSVEIIQENG